MAEVQVSKTKRVVMNGKGGKEGLHKWREPGDSLSVDDKVYDIIVENKSVQ